MDLLRRKRLIAAAMMAAALLIAGCGGGDESTESDGSSQSPEADGAAKTGDLSTAFGEIPGYELAPLPPEALENARTAYQEQVRAAGLPPDAIEDIDGRVVQQEGQEVARVLGLSFNPAVSSAPGFHDSFVKAAAGEGSTSVELSGHDARTFALPSGVQGVILSEGRIALLVLDQGGSGTDLEGIMNEFTAYL